MRFTVQFALLGNFEAEVDAASVQEAHDIIRDQWQDRVVNVADGLQIDTTSISVTEAE